MRQFAEAEQIAADILKASRLDTAALSILARALIGQDRGAEAIMGSGIVALTTSDRGIGRRCA